MEVARRFGENLRRLRKATDVSQEELGFRSSLHRTEIGLLEKGSRVPRIDTLIKLASGLGIRIDCALLEGITWTLGSTEAGAFMISSRFEQGLPAGGGGKVRGERASPRSAWWDEVLPILEDHSIETSGLYLASDIRRDGLVLIRAIDAYPNPLSRDRLTGWAALCCKDYDDEEYTRSVRNLEAVGLLQFYGSTPMVEPTRAAMRFHDLLKATQELRQRQGED